MAQQPHPGQTIWISIALFYCLDIFIRIQIFSRIQNPSNCFYIVYSVVKTETPSTETAFTAASHPAGVKELIIIAFHLHKLISKAKCTYYLTRVVTSPFVYIVSLFNMPFRSLTQWFGRVSASQQKRTPVCCEPQTHYFGFILNPQTVSVHSNGIMEDLWTWLW